jgi:hypothetical protein
MRDPDKWWTFFSESIGVASASLAFRFAGILDPQGLGRGAVLSLLIIDVLVGPGTTEDSAKLRFVEHCERVRKIVPKEHLLEYEVKAGWDPLCSFLHVEVPAVEFLRTNDKQMVLDIVSMTRRTFAGHRPATWSMLVARRDFRRRTLNPFKPMHLAEEHTRAL